MTAGIIIVVAVVIFAVILFMTLYFMTSAVCQKSYSYRACVLFYKKAPPKLIGTLMPAEALCGWLRNVCGWG